MNVTTAFDTRILVAATNVEDAKMVAELLREDFEQVGTATDPDHAVRDFERFRPQVLVLAFKTLEESERFYLGLYRLSGQVHAIPHRTLVLCQRTDAYRAYELCRKQHFDDYVVFWPVNYDPQRVRMAALLAARAGTVVGSDGPSPVEFAAQARRIAELEVLLQRSLARGDEQIAHFSDSLRQVESDVGQALEGFSCKVLDGRHDDLLEIKNREGFQRELTRLQEDEMRGPFATVDALLEPVRQWVESFRQELAPQLDSVRALAELAVRVRPVVLMVDDDEFQQRLVQSLLAEVAVDLVFADSGTQAMAQLRTHRPDLILMDFQLPDISGVEVMRRLKLASGTAGIPVILITGTSTREVLLQSHKAGAVDFMVKPFDRNRLIASINKHL
ncbi:MAG: response regulator [Proteobacteria bacterium]|nr:response regulator [Pseudomonadota bacterium]